MRFSGAANPFFARFAADPATIACVSGLNCFGGQLQTDLSGGATAFNVNNLILWTATLVDPDANQNTLRLLHRYDFLPVTANPDTEVFSSSVSYEGVDRVRFNGTAPAGLSADTDYFVVSPTTSSFKVSLTKNGPAVNITSSGPFQAGRVRIIGDDSAEQYTTCSPSSPPPANKVPSMKATKVTPGDDDLFVCLWDSSNGSAGPGS